MNYFELAKAIVRANELERQQEYEELTVEEQREQQREKIEAMEER